MGYRTYYTLSIHRNEDALKNDFSEVIDNESEIIKDLRSSYPDTAGYAIDERGASMMECSWHDHEDELLRFSRKYPDLVFSLHGMGDDDDDRWYKHFKNGKRQKCIGEVVYPPYKEELLS